MKPTHAWEEAFGISGKKTCKVVSTLALALRPTMLGAGKAHITGFYHIA